MQMSEWEPQELLWTFSAWPVVFSPQKLQWSQYENTVGYPLEDSPLVRGGTTEIPSLCENTFYFHHTDMKHSPYCFWILFKKITVWVLSKRLEVEVSCWYKPIHRTLRSAVWPQLKTLTSSTLQRLKPPAAASPLSQNSHCHHQANGWHCDIARHCEKGLLTTI